MKGKKPAAPQFYDDQFVLGYIKNKRSFKWTYIVADDGYLDSYYFPDVFGEKEDLEPLLVALMQVQANLNDKRVHLTKFLQQSLSPEILNNYPLVKGKYIYPGEINNPDLSIQVKLVGADDEDDETKNQEEQ